MIGLDAKVTNSAINALLPTIVSLSWVTLVSKVVGRFFIEGNIMSICSVDGCERKVKARGWCGYHWQNWYKHGIPEPDIKHQEKHGMYRTKVYRTWERIIRRCYNPNSRYYHRYGGRGIEVCNKWRESFIAFFDDMGEPPTQKHEIDRIDNDGNYEPSNCKWVTHIENMRHTMATKLTAENVQDIRKLYKTGNYTYGILADKYGVVARHIGGIVKGKKWPEPLKCFKE